MKIKALTTAALFTAIGVASAHIIHIPVGASKVFPVQHAINLLTAVLLGPAYAVAVAFMTSLLRNLLGTGTLLAFPGSMIGAFLAAWLFKKTKKPAFALAGEVAGTGILGALLSYPVAALLMGREVAALFFVVPFAMSALAGGVLGYVLFGLFQKSGMLKILQDRREL